MAESPPGPAPSVLDRSHETAARTRHAVTAVEFDVVWERLELGPTPIVLQLPSPGRTGEQRREVRATGWRTLRERGLADSADVDPELARMLRLLAHPAAQLELRGRWGHEVRAVAAGRPEDGVLAVLRDTTVTLESCTSLPAALLGLLPAVDPGPGRAVTVPTGTLAAVATSGPGLRAALIGQGVPAVDAGLLARMLAPGNGRAQIVALVADRTGILRRAGGVLGVSDAAGGRYLVTRTVGPDRVGWTTIAPIDGRRLRQRLVDLLTEAVDGAHE